MSEPSAHTGEEQRHFARSQTYLTSEVPGVGGVIRQRAEDFVVDEVPLGPPSGAGDHVLLLVQKADLTTEQVARILADHFQVRISAIGYAGRKDRVAVTRQQFSVHLPGRDVGGFSMIEHERVAVLGVDRHHARLERGELAGNRFSIRIRAVDPTSVTRAARCLRMLEKQGVPNRVGVQRFGTRENNHLVGRELFRGKAREALHALLGPGTDENDPHREVWGLYARGAYAEAIEHLPGSYRVERAVLEALARGDSPGRAITRISNKEKGFFLSAFQSAVFNSVLDRRVIEGSFAEALPGDLLVRADGNDAVARGEALTEDLGEQLARFERSASGPMWGTRMPRAGGVVDAMELEALQAFGLSPQDLEPAAKASIPMSGGTRRALRVRLGSPDVEGGLDEHGSYIRVAFDLPRGSFATEVLREIMKTSVEEDSDG